MLVENSPGQGRQGAAGLPHARRNGGVSRGNDGCGGGGAGAKAWRVQEGGSSHDAGQHFNQNLGQHNLEDEGGRVDAGIRNHGKVALGLGGGGP